MLSQKELEILILFNTYSQLFLLKFCSSPHQLSFFSFHVMNALCETQETYTLLKGNIFHFSPQSPLQTLINLNSFHTPAE